MKTKIPFVCFKLKSLEKKEKEEETKTITRSAELRSRSKIKTVFFSYLVLSLKQISGVLGELFVCFVNLR